MLGKGRKVQSRRRRFDQGQCRIARILGNGGEANHGAAQKKGPLNTGPAFSVNAIIRLVVTLIGSHRRRNGGVEKAEAAGVSGLAASARPGRLCRRGSCRDCSHRMFSYGV